MRKLTIALTSFALALGAPAFAQKAASDPEPPPAFAPSNAALAGKRHALDPRFALIGVGVLVAFAIIGGVFIHDSAHH